MLIPFPLTKESTAVSRGKNFTLESYYVELLQLLSSQNKKIDIPYIEECLGFTNENCFVSEHLVNLQVWGLVNCDGKNGLWWITDKGRLVEQEIRQA